MDLADARADGRATYIPAEGKLYAVRHADGKLAWPALDLAALTGWPRDASWRVVAGRRSLIAHPVSARPLEPVGPLAGRLAARPYAMLLPGVAATLTQAALDGRLPLVWIDPDAGIVLSRHELAVTGLGVAVAAGGNFTAVAAAGRAYLLKSP